MFFVLKVVVALIVIVLVLAFARSWQVESSENQKIFAANAAPQPALDGLYSGSVSTPVKVTWLGKKFNAASSTGINVFDDGQGGQHEGYPFATSVATNGTSTVLNIDYAHPDNPFWIRPILDQLVQVAPGEYLGKLTVRLVPGYPMSLGFFQLKK
jgi:hypothetical protein